MLIRYLQSPAVTSIPSTLNRTALREKALVSGQVIKIPIYKGYPDARKHKLVDFRAKASGATKFRSQDVAAIPKDVDLVFVAGATGRVGSRTVRELLKLGFRVRAGVRSAQRAESLVQSVEQMKTSEGTKQCDLEKRGQIGPALGNASIVICCIGASEKEVFDITGPYRIDYQATKNLIDAATVAKVNHFILLTSLGTNKFGFPAAILNLFWGVLIWKRKAEETLLASGLPYTIVRPGGMERPTDAYKETHNISLSQEDTLFGGQVSNLQVAELMAFMAKDRSLSYCKVVEVIAETTAPLTPIGELLAKIPPQRIEVFPPKESDAAGGPGPAVSKSIVSETPSTTVEKEPAKANASPTRPLSPYITYEDLKPPTSPTPTPSTTASAPKAGNVEAVPAALNSAPSSNQINLSQSSTTIIEKEAISTVVKKTSPLSPYIKYDDLKPPTSPSPKAPTASLKLDPSLNGGSQMATVSGNSKPKPASADKPDDEQHHSEPTPRPLSPFTMYEDLKPPTSPTPSPRKL